MAEWLDQYISEQRHVIERDLRAMKAAQCFSILGCRRAYSSSPSAAIPAPPMVADRVREIFSLTLGRLLAVSHPQWGLK